MTVRPLRRILLPALAFSALLPARQMLAEEFSPSAVTFAPSYEETFKRTYGIREESILRSQVADRIAQSLESVGNRCSRPLNVTIERAAPTHPTIKQQLDNPSLDPVRTVFRDSGASLSGQVLDSSGHVLETVEYEQFNGFQPGLSPAKDPWSEARVAIDGFARRLVNACVKQSAR